MLSPETRVLLTDALRPPASSAVDLAIGTTYTLDLTALLLAPLTFAALEAQAVDGQIEADPLALLDSVRRYADRTTVFCQAGAIAVPAAYRSVLTFAEDCVHQVRPVRENRIFHPKTWALRFIDEDGTYAHRFVVLSRNLTFDASWDTILVLDEDPDGTVDTAPIATFLRALPTLVTAPLPQDRIGQVRELATTIAATSLRAPEHYSTAQIIPLGLTGEPESLPVPDRAIRMVAISPFLDRSLVQRLPRSNDKTLVSRPETFDRLGADALGAWETATLARAAERAPAELEAAETADAQPAAGELDRVREGLHAKTIVLDFHHHSLTLTGSANLTGPAWNGNIELSVLMRGTRNDTGVQAVLDGTAGQPGLRSVLEDYHPPQPDGARDPTEDTALLIDRFHQTLAGGQYRAVVTAGNKAHDDEGQREEQPAAVASDTKLRGTDPQGTLELDLTGAPELPEGAEAIVWPIALPQEQHLRALTTHTPPTWYLSLAHITPFFAIETVAGDGKARTRRVCVIKVTLSGDTGARRHAALRHVLRSKDDVARYLAYLLGDFATGMQELLGSGDGFGTWGNGAADLTLFEPLVKAAAAGDEGVDRVATVVAELAKIPDGADLIPDGFAELWSVIEEVRRNG